MNTINEVYVEEKWFGRYYSLEKISFINVWKVGTDT